MVDRQIKKIESGRRDFSVNRKPAHVGRCRHCDSAHPVSHTTSAVSPLFRQEKIHTPQKWRNSIFAKTDTHSKRRPPRAATKNKPGTQNSQKRATPPPSKRVWDRILKKKRKKGYKRSSDMRPSTNGPTTDPRTNQTAQGRRPGTKHRAPPCCRPDI